MLQIFSDTVSLLFPNLCNGCGTALYGGEKQLCTGCLNDLPYTDFHLFPDNRVAKQLWGRVEISSAIAMLYFKKANRVQNIMHQLKYRHKTDLGIFMGRLLGARLLKNNDFSTADWLVPVPLHPARQKKRGYNQSQLICAGASEILSIPVSSNNLIRALETTSQTKKSRYMRYENMQSVFLVVNSESYLNKHLILIDDVITTGATLEACAISLLEAGAAKVSIAALAFTE